MDVEGGDQQEGRDPGFGQPMQKLVGTVGERGNGTMVALVCHIPRLRLRACCRQDSSAIFLAFSTAWSMPPTM